ncbi:hypothetical protein C8Q79DRAFT_146798 [Trametes meyenii]|nr:hypothetical protein C8Q79DRAFT_146798 [Trametes meyenii]
MVPFNAPSPKGIMHPSWTILSTQSTPEDRHSQLSNSHTTTPEPADTNSTTSMAQVDPQKLSTQQLTTLSTCTTLGGDSGWGGGGPLSPTNITKRKLPETPEGPIQPQQKKSRSTVSTIPNAVHGPQIIQRPQHSNIPSPKVIDSSSSSGAPVTTPASTVARPRRQPKRPPPITEESGMREWRRVDELLNTHVAPSCVLPKYARSLSLPQKGGGAQARVSLRVDDFRQRSKGKGRAGYARTTPHWSNVGEFKERLDAMFGPGHYKGSL